MKFLAVVTLLCIIFCTACEKNAVTIGAAKKIAGDYTAYKLRGIDSVSNYPINGKTITMQIDAISKDSVRIQIKSTQNGYFSPGDTLIDRHIFVQTLEGGSYQISLDEPQDSGTAENSILFYDGLDSFYPIYAHTGHYGYYTYVPPGYKQGAVQTAFMKVQ